MAEKDREAPNGHEGETNGRLPLDRRDFLRSVLAGTAVEQGLAGGALALDDGEPSSGVEVDGRVANQHTPAARRSYFPAEPDYLSVRGLAPKRDDPRYNDVWLGYDPPRCISNCDRAPVPGFSVASLAQESSGRSPNSGRPSTNDGSVSVRELRTPQWGKRPGTGQAGWENWLGDYEKPNAKEVPQGFGPSQERGHTDLLQQVVGQVEGEFRGVGSGHSHSEAAVPKELFTDIKELEGELPRPWLRDPGDDFWKSNTEPNPEPPSRDHLIRLRGGTILKKLNRKILPNTGVNGRKPLALPNMGAWDGQTLAGAINTSTHGSGLGLGTFADLVRSVEIITIPESQYASGESHVRMFRIEPSDGVTDPKKFAADAGTHDMVLIQDDDIFHSVVVGYGSMGMVYAYTLELRDHPFWLEEKNSFKPWGTFNPYQEAQPSNNRHYQFLVNIIQPQLAVFNGTGPSDAPSPVCLVRKRNEVDPGDWNPTERSNARNEVTKYVRALNGNPELLEGGFDITELVAPDPPFLSPSNGAGKDKSASYIALRRKQDRNPDDLTKAEPPVSTITTEIAVPASKVAPAVDAVIEFVLYNSRLFFPPLGVRFTAGSEHFFSPEYGRETAMLELPIPLPDTLKKKFDEIETANENPAVRTVQKPKNAPFRYLKELNQNSRDQWDDGRTGILDHMLNIDVAKEELEKLEDILVKKFNGRPHMGKHNTVNANSSRSYMKPQNMYPEYDKWLDAYRYFNHSGTFDGTFTDNKTP